MKYFHKITSYITKAILWSGISLVAIIAFLMIVAGLLSIVTLVVALLIICVISAIPTIYKYNLSGDWSGYFKDAIDDKGKTKSFDGIKPSKDAVFKVLNFGIYKEKYIEMDYPEYYKEWKDSNV